MSKTLRKYHFVKQSASIKLTRVYEPSRKTLLVQLAHYALLLPSY